MAEKTKTFRGHQSLIIHIGSAYVSGAVLAESRRGLPELSQAARVPLAAGGGATEGIQIAMQNALDEVLKKYAPLKLRRVRIVLASPWHHGRIRRVSSPSDKPISVSERTVERVVAKYKDEAPPEPGRVDLEAVAFEVKVNGYPTALASPVVGTSVKINLYESEIDIGVKTAIDAAIARGLPGSLASFHSFPLIAATALRIAAFEDSFIFADLGGEVTELGIMHEDGIHYLGSFPTGHLSIARVAGSQQADATSRLSLYARGELSPEEAGKMSEGLARAMKEWITSVESALKAAAGEVPMPRALFLITDPEALPWFMKGIEGTATFAPIPADAALLQRLVSAGEGALFEPSLMLAAIFFHTGMSTVVGEPELSRILQHR